MTRKITAAQLTKLDACKDQVRLFRRLFPDGVVPTAEICIKHATDFNWDGAAMLLLSSRQYRVYERLARLSALADREFDVYVDRPLVWLRISITGFVVALLAFLASLIFRMDLATVIFAVMAVMSFIATVIITITLDVKTWAAIYSIRSLKAKAFAEAYLSGTAK